MDEMGRRPAIVNPRCQKDGRSLKTSHEPHLYFHSLPDLLTSLLHDAISPCPSGVADTLLTAIDTHGPIRSQHTCTLKPVTRTHRYLEVLAKLYASGCGLGSTSCCIFASANAAGHPQALLHEPGSAQSLQDI
jgi:hypothetical protein